GYAAVAPVNGDSDLVGLLAVDHHRLDALGDHGFGDVFAARTTDFQLLTAANAHLVRHFRRNLNKWLRDKLHVHGVVLGPIVVVLGQAIGCADDAVIFGVTVLVEVRFKLLCYRVSGLSRVQRIRDRTLGRFVVLGEWPVGDGADGNKQPADTLRVHN